MQTKINEKQITEILKNFYQITGLKTTIFSVDGVTLADYPKSHCAFCHYINSFDDGRFQCNKSNIKALETCKTTKDTFIYRCHMGLVEVAFPLMKNEQIIGYAMFGQISNLKENNHIKEKLRNFATSITDEKLQELLSSVEYHSLELIKSEIKILEICATYFITSQMIEYNADLINKILTYIDNTPLPDFKISNLCDHFKISRTQLYNIFTKHKKIGVAEYVTSLKIKKATELLKSQQYSVKEIAYMTGFSDSNHFIKVFKKNTGTTPKQFQNSL